MTTTAMTGAPLVHARAGSGFALAAAALFLALLAALHALKADIDPSWHFISDYALGNHGWLMTLAFLALGLGYLALLLAIRPWLTGWPGRAGQVFMVISALGLLLAMSPTDPITTPPDEMTSTGMIHAIGGMLGLAMPFAAAFVGWALMRQPTWQASRSAVLVATGLAIAGFLIAFVSLGFMLSQSGGAFGPAVPVGWPNRLEIVANVAWLAVIAWHARQH